ncbi:hypothetical protein DPX16_19094 [Anabarilius grahami]|uniref:Uncharacterized protein n=1 Tax=Anabarilius grahami TaxID=495550 RepID=A0A3N0YWB5_ANAGA|nr:hypothetical protein DPX16_19094 [Anabarilius grahami]
MPESRHIMSAKPVLYIMPARPETVHVMPAKPETIHVMSKLEIHIGDSQWRNMLETDIGEQESSPLRINETGQMRGEEVSVYIELLMRVIAGRSRRDSEIEESREKEREEEEEEEEEEGGGISILLSCKNSRPVWSLQRRQA